MAALSSLLLVLLAVLAFGFVVVVARHMPRTAVEGLNGGTSPSGAGRSPHQDRGRRLHALLKRSFRETLVFLRGIVPGHRYAYAAPWFMLIGLSGAGKTALLDSVERSSRVGVKPPAYRDRPETHTWRFFDTGVVLDVSGTLLLEAGDATAGAEDWQELLRLLRNFRPRRPLDGVVLAISCEDLLAQEQLGQRAIAAAADVFYRRLWTIQQHLGLCLPIYLILTKADSIPGFAGFALTLAAERSHEIVGWSNPSDVATPFEPRLASHVINHIAARFRQLHLDIAANVDKPPDADGLLVFPGALQRLTVPIQAILGSLFRPSAYHEPFFLRGIYLSGVADAAAVEEGAMPLRQTVEHLYPGDRFGAANGPGVFATERLPLFLRDLFNRKIFAETALAVAASGGPVHRARSVRIAQGALVLAVILLGVGLTLETMRLERGIDGLRPAFVAVDQGLAGLAQGQPAPKEGQSDANRFPGAEAFLGGLADINLNSLWSFWLPSSWFSSLHGKTVDFLSTGFSGVLLPTMRRELQRRVEAAIGGIAALAQGGATPPPLAAFAGSSDFERLNSSVRELIALEATAKLFNRINSGAELDDIAQLADILLGIKVSDDFNKNVDLYRQALKQAHVIPYSFGPTATRADDAVLAAFRSIEARFSDDGPILSPLASLSAALGNLEAGSSTGADPEVTTTVVIALLARSQQLLNDPALAWIAGKSVAQIPELDSLLNAMSRSEVFGPDMAGELRKRLDADLHQLQQHLAALNAPEIGPLLDQQNGQISLKLAPPIAQLSEQLSAMLKYTFMTARGDSEPQLAANSATIVNWDIDTLRTALDFYRGYEHFEAKELAAVPHALAKPLDDFARRRLRGSMNRAIRVAAAGSNTGSTAPPTATIIDEGSVFNQADNFRRAAPVLGDIISVLQQLNFNEVAEQLRTLATKQAYELLEEIDQLGDADQLYLPQRPFAVANDNISLLQSAYLLRSDVEAAQYLDTERDRIARLAQGAAEAAVGFLGRSDIAGTAPMPLVGKWRGILSVLRSYQNGDSSGSVGALQNFIRFDLAAANRDNCPVGVNANGAAADFFGQRLEMLRREAASVCSHVTLATTATEYDQIASLFNRLLAGRYPFGPAGAAPVEIAGLTEFFRTFTAQEAAVRAALGTGAGVSGAPAALQFLDELDKASTFFAPLLAPSGTAAYDLSAAFRVNRRREHGGDQIIDWSISAGDTSLHGDHPNGRWFPGDPVTVRLRWAKDSPTVPYGSSGEPQIDGTTAIFHYEGRWSLLRLLGEHRAAPNEFEPGSADGIPSLLKFVIPVSVANAGGGAAPTGPSDRVTVFIHLGLTAPSATPQQTAILAVPDFPQRAPALGGTRPNPLFSATGARFTGRPEGGR